MVYIRIVRSEWIIWLCGPRVRTWKQLCIYIIWVHTTNSNQVFWKVGRNWRINKTYLMSPQYLSIYGHKLSLEVLRKLREGRSIYGNFYLLICHIHSRNRQKLLCCHVGHKHRTPHGAPVRHPHLLWGLGIRPRCHSKAYDLGYLLIPLISWDKSFWSFFYSVNCSKNDEKREFHVKLCQRKSSNKYFFPKTDQFRVNEPWEVQNYP